MRFDSRSIALSLLGCCLFAASPNSTNTAQAQPPAQPKIAVGTAVDPSKIYDQLLSNFEKQFVAAAEAMPEDKFNFTPASTAGEFTGVRTFSAEVKHVTQANYYFFHDPEAPLVDNRAEIEKLTSKADIVKALKDSFALAHTYISGITAQNAFVQTKNGTRAGQASLGIAHFMDHYGQMAVYLRMNGIVPPASRK